MENISVSIKDLSLRFGRIEVLNSMNLEIKQGEFLVLLGPSGCGKSTLLNCIAGLLDVSDGQIFIEGKNVTWEEPKDRGIGMVFQSYALYPQMSVEKNLSFGLRVAGMKKPEIEERVKRAAEILQIEPLLNRKPVELSGGQRQRVAIGRALVRDVDVFLFDEPLSNLDAKLRSELRVEIKLLHQKLSNTMIYVTHDQIEALTLADRVAVMKGGVIQQLDDPTTIYEKPVNLFVAGFMGSPSMNFLHGEVIEKQGNQSVSFKGIEIPIRSYPSINGIKTGTKVILGARPEYIKIDEKEEGTVGPFEAVVEVYEPMGADSIVWILLGGKEISVRVAAGKRYTPEEKISVYFKIPSVSIFDAATEQRL
ncbi:MAG: ABC transporter ATP-binding protein [SAR324 cluster bacterium]|nr:ABC transporter ATP-binding protein [SAR324 cluster bacterium]